MSAASSTFVELDRRPAARRRKGAVGRQAQVLTSAIAVTTTVSTYERSDALCSAGAMRRLKRIKAGQRERVQALGLQCGGPAEPPQSSARREQPQRTSERQRAQQQRCGEAMPQAERDRRSAIP